VWLDGEGDAAIRGDDRRCSLYCPPTTPLHLHQPHSTSHCPSACARVCTDVIGFDRRNSPPVRSDAPVAIVPHSLWHDQQTATSRDDRGDEPQLLQLIRLAKCSEFTLSRTRTLNGSCVARSITHTHTHTQTFASAKCAGVRALLPLAGQGDGGEESGILATVEVQGRLQQQA
jgi:hypothetical protein